MKIIFFLRSIWYSILGLFSVLEYGNVVKKAECVLIMSLLTSPFVWLTGLMNRYIFADKDFAEVLLVLLVLDIASGIAKHWKDHTFDFKELFTKLLEKVFVSLVGMILFNTIAKIGIEDNEAIKYYFVLVGKLANAFYIGGSAFNNLFLITGGKFPPVGWMNRMKKFNQSGNVKDLTDDDCPPFTETEPSKDI